MNPAPAPPLTPVPATPSRSALLTAWPRPAQLVLAFALGLATGLLGVRGWDGWRRASKPAELERGAALAYRIDLNQAERAELLQLPGVGDSLADRIEDYRRQHGSFRSVEELVEVEGVGPATLQRLRPWVEVRPGQASPVPSRARSKSTPAAGKMGGKKADALDGPIDVNRASLEELQRLPGIGPKLAQRIVDERRKGPFRSPDELRRVSGIGPKKLEALRPYITVGDEPVPVASARP